MVMLERKLEMFKKLIYDSENEKLQDKLDNMNSKDKEKLYAYKEKLEIKNNANIKINKRNALNKKNEMILEEQQSSRQKLLKIKEQYLEQILEDIKNKSREYVKTENYIIDLKNNILKSINNLKDDDIVILLIKKDEERLGENLKEIINSSKKNISIEYLENKYIGGFMIRDKAHITNYDMTISSRILNNKYEIGSKLYGLMDEVGDNIG